MFKRTTKPLLFFILIALCVGQIPALGSDNSLLIKKLVLIWKSNLWVADQQILYTYDSEDKLIERLHQKWIMGQLTDYARGYYKYNAGGFLEKFTYVMNFGYAWINQSCIIFSYDASGNPVEQLSMVWKEEQWQNSEKITHTYDIDGNLIEELSQLWRQSQWQNAYRYIYSYNGSRKYEQEGQLWGDSVWFVVDKFRYYYDANGNLVSVMRFKEQDGWDYIERTFYVYGPSDELLKEQSQWHFDDGWQNFGMVSYSYDEFGNMIESLSQKWRNDQWENSSKILCTYDIMTDVKENNFKLPGHFSLAQNFPNPFNASTEISFDLSRRCPVELSVFNVVGQKVRTIIDAEIGAGSHTVIWDGLDTYGQPVASGVYFYRLNAGDFSETKKMLMIK